MATHISGIVVLLMTVGVLSFIHGASRVAVQDFASGAPTLCIGAAGAVQAFVMSRKSGPDV